MVNIQFILTLLAIAISVFAVYNTMTTSPTPVNTPIIDLVPLQNQITALQTQLTPLQSQIANNSNAVNTLSASFANVSAKAAAAFKTTSDLTSVTIINSFNIASIVRNQAGNYTVTFTNALATIPIISVGLQRVGTNDIINLYNITTTGFSIEDRTGTSLNDNLNYISFVCHAPKTN